MISTKYECFKSFQTSYERETKTIRLHIDILTLCNQKCWYCYTRAENFPFKLITIVEWERFVRALTDLKYEHIDFIFLGGEPSLHPHLNEFIEIARRELSNKELRFVICSNGSKELSLLEDIEVGFFATYHPSQQKDHSQFLKVVTAMKAKATEVVCYLMLDPAFSDELVSVIESLKEAGIEYRPLFMFNPENNLEIFEYDTRFLDLFRNDLALDRYLKIGEEQFNDLELYEQKKNNFFDWNCLNNNYTVNIYGHLQRMCGGGELGNVYIEPKNVVNKLNTVPLEMICNQTVCQCYGTLSFYKWKK